MWTGSNRLLRVSRYATLSSTILTPFTISAISSESGPSLILNCSLVDADALRSPAKAPSGSLNASLAFSRITRVNGRAPLAFPSRSRASHYPLRDDSGLLNSDVSSCLVQCPRRVNKLASSPTLREVRNSKATLIGASNPSNCRVLSRRLLSTRTTRSSLYEVFRG